MTIFAAVLVTVFLAVFLALEWLQDAEFRALSGEPRRQSTCKCVGLARQLPTKAPPLTPQWPC